MIVEIIVSKSLVKSIHPRIEWEFGFSTEDETIHNVKGACLVAISYWEKVPDKIEFKIVKENQ